MVFNDIHKTCFSLTDITDMYLYETKETIAIAKWFSPVEFKETGKVFYYINIIKESPARGPDRLEYDNKIDRAKDYTKICEAVHNDWEA